MQSLEELVLGADCSCFDVKRCRGLLALDAGRGGEFLLRTADQQYYVHAAPDWHTTSDLSKPCPAPDLEGAHVYMDLENSWVLAASSECGAFIVANISSPLRELQQAHHRLEQLMVKPRDAPKDIFYEVMRLYLRTTPLEKHMRQLKALRPASFLEKSAVYQSSKAMMTAIAAIRDNSIITCIIKQQENILSGRVDVSALQQQLLTVKAELASSQESEVAATAAKDAAAEQFQQQLAESQRSEADAKGQAAAAMAQADQLRQQLEGALAGAAQVEQLQQQLRETQQSEAAAVAEAARLTQQLAMMTGQLNEVRTHSARLEEQFATASAERDAALRQQGNQSSSVEAALQQQIQRMQQQHEHDQNQLRSQIVALQRESETLSRVSVADLLQLARTRDTAATQAAQQARHARQSSSASRPAGAQAPRQTRQPAPQQAAEAAQWAAAAEAALRARQGVPAVHTHAFPAFPAYASHRGTPPHAMMQPPQPQQPQHMPPPPPNMHYQHRNALAETFSKARQSGFKPQSPNMQSQSQSAFRNNPDASNEHSMVTLGTSNRAQSSEHPAPQQQQPRVPNPFPGAPHDLLGDGDNV
ncbi:hypothetical protein JKP88DRAFT_240980 [Tribonema minus]|uniref:Uncharacterized protein n=1 Tax=Tribonema minus TaxID=303371 RepID=A0A835ZCD0_9STRA|nr:hypothetical protein JKP88DRAFT_240980 [Tribonema minus]